MLSLWIAVLSSCAHPVAYSKAERISCDEGAREIEASLANTKLDQAKLHSFEEIASSRAERGLEVLPGMLGCGSVTSAALEIGKDGTTQTLLVQHKLAAADYVKIGWAAVVAVDPQAMSLGNLTDSDLIRHNGKEVRKRRKLMTLMFDK